MKLFLLPFQVDKPSRSRSERSGHADRREKGKASSSKAEPLRPAAKAHGWPVCYSFNSTKGCSRPKESSGLGCLYVLADGKEVHYAHVCNQWVKADDKYCLGAHGRSDHK